MSVGQQGRRMMRGAALLLALSMAMGAVCAQTRGGQTAGDESDAHRRARTRLDLAAAYYAEGRFDTALEEVGRALVASPELPQALNLRGLIYSALNEDAQADDSFKRALRAAPDNPDTLHNYGWFMCQRGRPADADAMFERALSSPGYRTPNRTLLVQGVCAARAGKLEDAERSLKRAYELDASNPAAAMNLGAVLYRRGEYERARFYVRRVNGNPELRNAESLWLAARIENRLGNAQGVRELGHQLRSSYPGAPEAALFERGAFDE